MLIFQKRILFCEFSKYEKAFTQTNIYASDDS